MTRLLTLTVVTVSFFVSLQITKLLVVPVQDWFSLDPSYAALLFLPHGIRVVSVYILGPLSGFLHILFAVIIIEVVLDISYLSIATIGDYLKLLVGAASAPLAYVLTKFFVGAKYLSLERVNIRTWRIILLVCFLSAVINSIGQSVLVYIFALQTTSVLLVLKYMTGDFTGSVTIFLLLIYLFRKLERKSK